MTGRRASETALRRAAFRRGIVAESLAAALLALKGYRVLARRYRCPAGEIDLIARRGRLVIFVEVKRRGGDAAALEALTPRQRERIVRAAQWWLSRRRDAAGLDCRFDMVVARPYLWLRHIQNAFPGAPF